MERHRSEQIATELEEMILNGAIPEGERLDEVRLAEKFGVSRTPLREALQRLSQTGLVELLPRRGAFVSKPGALELIEMFEAMAELEASCARLAANRISDEALDALKAANDRCRTAIEDADPDRFYEENEGFHLLIYDQCGNRYLQQEAHRLHRRLRPYRRLQLRLRGRMRQSMAEHDAIVDALVEGDCDAVACAIRGHVVVQGEKFHNLMSNLKDAQTG